MLHKQEVLTEFNVYFLLKERFKSIPIGVN